MDVAEGESVGGDDLRRASATPAMAAILPSGEGEVARNQNVAVHQAPKRRPDKERVRTVGSTDKNRRCRVRLRRRWKP